MPLHRFVLLLWTFFAMILLGAWWHSLQRYSYVGLAHAESEQSISARLGGGGVELSYYASGMSGNEDGSMSNGPYYYSYPWQDAPLWEFENTTSRPGHFGQFHLATIRDGLAVNVLLNLPIWLLLLILTALSAILYRFFRKRSLSRFSAA